MTLSAILDKLTELDRRVEEYARVSGKERSEYVAGVIDGQRVVLQNLRAFLLCEGQS